MFYDPRNGGGVLRLTTAGSVDDGKSTLIGRLLLDAGAVPEDQVAALRQRAAKRGEAEIDLSLLTDGLAAEREQGITIDVAYRYFSAKGRKYILGDAPGHERYTRNMVTAASNADAAIILVDALKGMTRQTRRHLYIAHLLGLERIIVAVNKMDLVGFKEEAFSHAATELGRFAKAIGARDLQFVPIAAKTGDNVVHASANMPWYRGAVVLALLEEFALTRQNDGQAPFRFAVQLVAAEPGADGRQRRVLKGSVASGKVAVGQEILVQPSGERAKVAALSSFDGPLAEAASPLAIGLVVDGDLDIGRGDLIAEAARPAAVANRFEASLCWFDDRPFDPKRRYLLRQGTRWVAARIDRLVDRFDLERGGHKPAPDAIGANDIVRAALVTQSPLAFDPYRANRATGAFILVDEQTNATAAAGMIEG